MEEIKSHLQIIIKMKMDKMISSDPVVQTMDLLNIEAEEYSYINYEIKKDLYKQIEQYVKENEFYVDFIYEDPELLQEIVKLFNKYGGKIKYSLSPKNQLLQTYFAATIIYRRHIVRSIG